MGHDKIIHRVGICNSSLNKSTAYHSGIHQNHKNEVEVYWPEAQAKWHRADSRIVLSQWETVLLSNNVSNWLGTSLVSVLQHFTHEISKCLSWKNWFQKCSKQDTGHYLSQWWPKALTKIWVTTEVSMSSPYILVYLTLYIYIYIHISGCCSFMAIWTRQIRTPVLRIPPAVTSQAKMKNWLHECQKWVSHMIGHYAHI